MDFIRITCLLLCLAAISKAEGQTNQIPADSIKTQIKNQEETSYKVVQRGNDRCLKVSCASSAKTPSLYLVKAKVIPGRTYSYVVKFFSCQNDKVALYVTSAVGDIGWPSTSVEDNIMRQTFIAPPGISEVTLAVSFMYPRQNACVYLYDIGLFEGDMDDSSWESTSEAGLRLFLQTENVTSDSEEPHSATSKNEQPLPENIFFLNDLSEIKTKVEHEGQIQINFIEHKSEGFLKITCSNTAWTPSVMFKTLKVEPGQQYTFLLSAEVSNDVKPYFYIETTDSKNVVWPGLKIANGVNKQLFTVPDGVQEVNIGFSFVNPDVSQFVMVKDIGVYKGDVDPSQWIVVKNQGLEPWLRISYAHWLWLLFPLCIALLVLLYVRDKKAKRSYL